MPAPNSTREEILSITRDLVETRGIGSVSFDAIARRLGRTKQAVLYWFPSKQALLGALFLPWLEAETDIAERALAGVSGRDRAVAAFVRAVAGFHMADLDRFRMMYLVPQTTPVPARAEAVVGEVHPITDRLYAALSARLGADQEATRKEAVAIHAAVLGQVAMIGLADALRDPLKLEPEQLVDALVLGLTRR